MVIKITEQQRQILLRLLNASLEDFMFTEDPDNDQDAALQLMKQLERETDSSSCAKPTESDSPQW